jgi:cytidylate kinase
VAREVVCISHATGSDGEEVGRLVAERLGFSYVDEEVIARAAQEGGVDEAAIADAERRKPLFADLLDFLAGGETIGPEPIAPHDDIQSEALRGLIRDAIREVASRGRVVIVAHAASHAIGADERALRVLVTAPADTRARRISDQRGVTGPEGAKLVKTSDAGRVDYLKRFYGVAQEGPTQYDLVVNTETLSPEYAAALIAEAAS